MLKLLFPICKIYYGFNNFQEKRKIYHLRRVKLDKMKEIIEGKTKQSQLTPIRTAPKPPVAVQPRQPYPVAGPTAAPTNNWSIPISPTGYPGAGAPPTLPYPIHPTGMPSMPQYR